MAGVIDDRSYDERLLRLPAATLAPLNRTTELYELD
jgi:hypothetical protein